MADEKSPEEGGVEGEEGGMRGRGGMRETSHSVQERSVQEESLLFGKRVRLVLAFLGGIFTAGIPLVVVTKQSADRIHQEEEKVQKLEAKLQLARDIGNDNAFTAQELANMFEETRTLFAQFSILSNVAINECRRDSLLRSRPPHDAKKK